MVVGPDSPVYTPQQLATRIIGVPFHFGTHSAWINWSKVRGQGAELRLAQLPGFARQSPFRSKR
jgi:hypothetical protein